MHVRSAAHSGPDTSKSSAIFIGSNWDSSCPDASASLSYHYYVVYSMLLFSFFSCFWVILRYSTVGPNPKLCNFQLPYIVVLLNLNSSHRGDSDDENHVFMKPKGAIRVKVGMHVSRHNVISRGVCVSDIPVSLSLMSFLVFGHCLCFLPARFFFPSASFSKVDGLL